MGQIEPLISIKPLLRDNGVLQCPPKPPRPWDEIWSFIGLGRVHREYGNTL